MEQLEPPECPVCLQPYDSVSAIPRVLTCGHTTCEACLKQLPNPFPNTIRCSVCIALIKFPNDPSNLPKNLDLMHFSSVLQHHPTEEKKVNSSLSPPRIVPPFIPNSWSYEFYRKWKKWILRSDSILIEEMCLENDDVVVYVKVSMFFDRYDPSMASVDREKENVGLVKIGIFAGGEEDSNVFKGSHESRIVSVLCGFDEKKRNELGFVLNATLEMCNVGNVYGFWYNENDMCVYMVCKKFDSPNLTKCLLNKKEDEGKRLNADEIRSLAMLGMDMCEVLSNLHRERLVIGYLGSSCFGFNDFGRVYVDLCEVLNMGRRVDMEMQRCPEDLEVNLENKLLEKNYMFISPEMLLHFLVKEEIGLDRGKSRYEVGCASDVWSLACLLVWLIVGSSFLEEMEIFWHFVVSGKSDEKGSNFSCVYTSKMEFFLSLLRDRLGEEYVPLQEILCRCLAFDPRNRPFISDLWKCLREFVIKSQFDLRMSLKKEFKNEENTGHYVILGELCHIVEEELIGGKDDNVSADGKSSVDRDVVEAVTKGDVKCVELKGHIDCITGLAIGGGFLFSSSYDKLIHVWSLQDFTLVHSFKGHEHKVTTVVFADGEQPLCISGDNDGVICIWGVEFPFSEVPIEKISEQKDWRYSGIHAMTVSGTEYLYTGSGDKLVKAWSLQDYTLSCSMSGHKSVVSSLVICNGVLYSGSWDGTVRLWSLGDHSPLTVLGEDKIGNVLSILSLSAEEDLLVVGYENGSMKIWKNDILLKSIQTHKGSVFSVSKKGKWLLSGGWDKTICVQEISEDDDGMDVIPVGSIACNATITALLYWHGKLFAGQADRTIKVYHGT